MVDALMKKFGYKNVMQVPKLDKIVINMGVGEAKENAKVLDSAVRDLEIISGQKAITTKAKKSIANFKLREGKMCIRDSYLYYKGKLQKATDGQKYVCYRVEGRNYVVNASGKVMKGSNVKNSDGVKFTTNSSGELTKADDDSDVDSYAQEPTEPYCTE